jgi:hypothetical protein
MHELALEYIKKNKPAQVVLSNHSGGIGPLVRNQYIVGAAEFISEIAKHAGEVFWLGETPKYVDPRQCVNRDLTNIRYCGVSVNSNLYAAGIQDEVIKNSEVVLIDPTSWFCLDGVCPLFIGDTMAAAIQNHISQEIGIELFDFLYRALEG